ncbi:MAG: lamin tail domain-containing protein, partial [Acidobacteria bacterium]|nr:lamin tail domain-containing protein [Acidobacteriota bacterium]
GDGDLGTPGAANDCPPPKIVITEIIQNPAAVSDANGEWFEIFNPTDRAIDIDGWTIKDDDFDSHLIDNSGPLVIAASGFLVLARNDDSGANGGVTVDYKYSGITLGNSGDELVLLDTGLDEIDRVEWDNGVTFPDPNGKSMSLIASSLDNNVGANWCAATTSFGAGDKGTPGTFNDCVLEIFEIQTAGATSPFDGDVVTTKDNVVTAVGTNGFFMQTPTARSDADVTTSDGIFVFTGSPPTVAVGDLVNVTGEIEEFFAFTEFTGSPAVSATSPGNPVPAAVTFSASVPAPSMPQLPPELERYEGMLVEVSGGLVTGPTDRFGDFAVVAGPMRAFREPGIEFPGLPSLPVWDGNQEVFEVRAGGLGPAIATPDVPVGATVSATGPLAFRFGDYQIWPTALSVSGTITPDPVRERGHGEVIVGSLNMERFFSSDGDFAARGYIMNQDDRSRDLTTYLTPIDTIEIKTGLDFFPDLDEAVETVLEAAEHDELWGE